MHPRPDSPSPVGEVLTHPLGRHRARKRFGQNFLVDRTAIGRIIAAFDPQSTDRVVEIGPGLGALTRPLLEHVAHLHVVELDRDLAARLRTELPADRATVHEADALDFDFATLGSSLRVIGNLPYNISTPLLFHLAAFESSLADLHVMLQKEVVQRMVAKPGTPEYGRLSVMLQVRFRIARLFLLPPGAFRPIPKVESAVARLVPLGVTGGRPIDETVFSRVVALAFGQRRKTLRNTLRTLCAASTLARLGIDPGARGEVLGVDDFVRIADAIAADPPRAEAARNGHDATAGGSPDY